MKKVVKEMKRGTYRRLDNDSPKSFYQFCMTEDEKKELYDISCEMGITMAAVLRIGIELVKKERKTNQFNVVRNRR